MAYIGQKGFTISKAQLPEKDHQKIYDDLTIKPYDSYTHALSEIKKHYAFRENSSKFYLPRHYGNTHFGHLNPQNQLSDPHQINVSFVKQLRENQIPIIDAYKTNIEKGSSGGIIVLGCGGGKTAMGIYIAAHIRSFTKETGPNKGFKTIVLVHKEFLMNQWIERIADFSPNAKVGIIQGDIFDIEGKDFVIAMIQTLMTKTYIPNTFQSFGLLIVDEVHHISSDKFSNVLFKIVPRYTLGLTATIERNDKTEHVIEMFLGPIVFKGEKKSTHDAVVYGIKYESDDVEFNTVETDYTGKVMYSTMMSKLCVHYPRTEFCIDVAMNYFIKPELTISWKSYITPNTNPCNLCQSTNNYLVQNRCCSCVKYCLNCLEELKRKHDEKTTAIKNRNKRIKAQNATIADKTKHGPEEKAPRQRCLSCGNCYIGYDQAPCVQPTEDNPYGQHDHLIQYQQRQLMVIACNRNILDYIYNYIVCKNLISVGYYVGGMKQDDLNTSCTKQVMLMTYSMAAEALDVGTLTGIFMINPKSDVEQSIGRIMRIPKSKPVIFDLIDPHACFQNQYKRERKKLYKQFNYQIQECTSTMYVESGGKPKWKITYMPLKSNEENGSECVAKAADANGLESSNSDDEHEPNTSSNKQPKSLLKGVCLL